MIPSNDDLFAFIAREWFPQSIEDMARWWRRCPKDELEKNAQRLVAEKRLITFLHPVRRVWVYSIPSNFVAKQLLDK